MRYDTDREVYRDCKWCCGKGCLYCKAEADNDYRAAFPEGPKPFATFTTADLSRPEVRAAIGADALRRAFAPGGGGIQEIIENCRAVGATVKDESAK